MDIRTAIARAAARQGIAEAEMEEVLGRVMDGEATAAQMGALLVALHMKGETVEEITGAARAMRRHAMRVSTRSDVVDTCGTGGDMQGTINISTAAALLAAAAGVAIAKHGNRAMSGKVGGADVLEALGVRIDLPPEHAAACLNEVGIAFLFAPLFHPAMRHVAGPRREIGVRTIFNLLGPLANPAAAGRQLLGVFSGDWVEPLAHVLGRLGSQRAMIVHGEDGLDEISISGPTRVAEWRDGSVRTYRITPEEFGLSRGAADAVHGGDAAHNAAVIRAILAGSAEPAQQDIVLLNAAAAIYVAGRAPDVGAGLETARRTIGDGSAERKLRQLVEFTNR